MIESGLWLDWQPLNQTLIDVSVRGRIALEQILCVTDDLDARRCSGKRERQIELDRHGGPDGDVAFDPRDVLVSRQTRAARLQRLCG